MRAHTNLFGSYQFADSTEFYPITNPLCSARDVPGWGCDELQRTQHFTLTWTWSISPRLINESRVGYSRFGFFRLQEDRDVDVVNKLGIKGLTDAGSTPFNDGAPELHRRRLPDHRRADESAAGTPRQHISLRREPDLH